MNLASILESAARELPGRRALIDKDGQSISYGELNKLANRIGHGLKSLGVKRGDKVGLMLSNSIEWVAIWFGLTKIGAVLVPIGAFYKANEVEYILDKAEINTLFIEDNFLNVIKDSHNLLYLKNIVVIGEAEKGTTSLNDLIKGMDEHLSLVDMLPDELCAIWYTSGTTSFPKGVMLSHRAFAEHSAITPEVLQTNASDIMLSAVPCSSIVSKVTITGMMVSRTPTILLPRFSAELILETMQSQKATVFYGVPTMILYFIDEYEKNQSEYNLDSLRLIVSSAAPQAEKDVQRVKQLLPQVTFCRFYGATETTGGGPEVHVGDVRVFGHRPDSVGRPIRGTEVKLVDENGLEVLEGEQGELIWRGPGLMQGYWKEPELTEQVIKNGFYHSGDLAKKDEMGMFYITGRIKDTIICGGFNIYPGEVETILKEHPAVFDCAVVGVPDDLRFEIPVAWVVLKDGVNGSEKELIDFCRERMAHYKAPRQVYFIEAIPRSAIGKVNKKELLKAVT